MSVYSIGGWQDRHELVKPFSFVQQIGRQEREGDTEHHLLPIAKAWGKLEYSDSLPEQVC